MSLFPSRREAGGFLPPWPAFLSGPSSASLWVVGGLLFYNMLGAVEPSIVAVLYHYGDTHMVMGRNPVTYCNILFISNLTASLTMIVLFHRQITWKILRSVTRRQWVSIMLMAMVGSVLMQTLYFLAVAHTQVANVVLISSLQIPIGALAAFMIFGERLSRRNLLGHGLIIVGIGSPFVFSGGGLGGSPGLGELLAVGAMLSRVAMLFLAKEIANIPTGIVGLVGTFIGTVFFFTTATVTYGPAHFQDLMTPNLWAVVVLYAVVLVSVRRILRMAVFRRSTRQNITATGASYPILALIAAVLIVGQIPGWLQVAGYAVLTVGAMLAINWSQPCDGGIRRDMAGDRAAVRCNA